MRVLQISWEYPPTVQGGLARHVAGLAGGLAARGVTVDVLTRAGAPDAPGSAVRSATVHGVTVRRVDFAGAGAFPHDMDRFLAWVATMNEALAGAWTHDAPVDLVHSHDWLVADAARRIAGAAGCPWIVTVHATEHGRHDGRVDRHPQSAVHRAECAMVAGADAVTCCSAFMRAHVADALGIAADDVAVTGNGIDVAAAVAPAGSAAALRARLAGDGSPLVALAGRVVHEKGIDLALRALARLRAGGIAVRLAVAGAGPAEEQLRTLAGELGLGGAVSWLGWRDDDGIRALYGAADLCVVPSRYEPFGLVVLEAMAAGCPCLVADTGGLSELVDGDERAGLRVPPEDVAALAAAVARALADPALRARIAAGGRAVASEHDWSRIAAATERRYIELTAGRAAT